ncbi:hypothetical protein WCX49_09005 [Sulfurimonas sp. HSL-1656]|uniref:hypothetical protein n=1 Tax=Thiomicrolovo subterrani TaxID=3131934 RepID=UPI0031F91FC5
MNKQMFNCTCLGKDGERRQYLFSLQKSGGSTWMVCMYDTDRKIIDDGLDLKFTPFTDDAFRITDMFINNQAYRSHGIVEAVICKVSQILAKTIVSSGKDVDKQDYRSPASDSFWKRAKENGWAEYIKPDDRYIWCSSSLCD